MRRMQRISRILLPAYLLLIAMMVLVHMVYSADGDKDWLLMAARMWLGGKQLYVDVMEVNPPLILWIYALAIKLSHILGIFDEYALTVMVLALVVLSALVCKNLMKLHPMLGGTKSDVNLFTLLVFTLLVVWPNPSYFADREHIFITLTLPYLVRFSPALFAAQVPPLLRFMVAVMAGIGFCIKPHCLLLLMAVNLYHVCRSRSVRILFYPENLAVYTSGAAYLTATWLVHPGYFNNVIPVAMATYGMYRHSIEFIILYIPAILTFAVVFAEFRPGARSPLRPDLYYWMLLALAAQLYALMNNGWMYTFYPVHSMVLVCMFYVWREYSWLKKNADSPDRQKKAAQGIVACKLVFVIHVLTVAGYAQVLRFPDVETMQVTVQQQCIADFSEALRVTNSKTFGTISLSAAYWPKLAGATGAQMETRFYTLWMLPSFMNQGDDYKQKNMWVLEYAANAVATDVNTNKPGILIEEIATPSRPAMNLREWLDFNPAFTEAMGHYEKMDVKAELSGSAVSCPYAIYRRKGG